MNEHSFIFLGGSMAGKFLLLNKEIPTFMTPEKFAEHINEFAKTARDFMDKEVHPVAEELQTDEGKMTLNPKLMAKAGELGLLMIEVPEEYEGMGLDLTTALRVAEQIDEASFGTTYMAHTGIGTLPIVFFGNEEQKKKYLPKIASGEWVSAYALTETGFGSDALGAKTKAVLSEDGKYYILNGAKQFITNSGFADLFIVYAKVDGEKFTAFLVERTFEGIKPDKEENKMGIHGSSTRPVILEDCKVPVENVLGEVGQGHKSALGILDIGRIKLGVAGISGAKRVLKLTTEYANNRKQFKTPIANFGMIRHKFAEIAARTFMFESAIYRTSGMIDEDLEKIDLKDPEYSKKVGKVFKDYDVETAMMKVLGSELVAYAVDQGVQIHGGYGFIEDYEIARMYRDARINRIFEGTNEINRLLVPVQILTHTMKGELNLMNDLNQILSELKEDKVDKSYDSEKVFDRELKVVELSKKIVIYTVGTFVKKFMNKLADKTFTFTEGEYYYEPISDMIMETYQMESGVIRGKEILEKGIKNKLTKEYVELSVYEKFSMIRNLAMQLITSLSSDEKELHRNMAGLWKLTMDYPLDTVKLKDKIASTILELGKYTI